MGDDFADDSESIPTSEEVVDGAEDDTSSEESEENETEDESVEDESEESESEEEEQASAGVSEDEDAEEDDDKSKVLQGLAHTEKELENDLSDLDIQIQTAKQRIVSKRQARRDRRELIQTIDTKTEDSENDDDLSDVDEDQVKLFERIAKVKGYVPRSELRAQQFEETRKTAQEEFLEKHPEYKPENDTDDSLYNTLKSELALYAAPEDPRLIPKLFERAHSAVKQQYPDKFSKTVKTVQQHVAASSRTKVASSGSQSPKSSTVKAEQKESSGTLSSEKIQILKNSGWSEADIAELME